MAGWLAFAALVSTAPPGAVPPDVVSALALAEVHASQPPGAASAVGALGAVQPMPAAVAGATATAVGSISLASSLDSTH